MYKMLYKKENSNELRILGGIFAENNERKGKLIINNKKSKITEKITTNNVRGNEIKVKLLLVKNISNKSCFFSGCKALLKVSMPKKGRNNLSGNIIKYKDYEEDEKFIDIYPMDKKSSFYDDYESKEKYKYLNISEISKTEIKSDTDTIKNDINNLNLFLFNGIYLNFKEMFYNCSSLNSISDIFEFNNDKYKILDMSSMFDNCQNLNSLPDISEFNIEKVIDMSSLFNNCSSLETLPNIYKWNTFNVTDMNSIFSNCKSLKSLPDISCWDTSNVINMSKMFYECSKLINLPDTIYILL